MLTPLELDIMKAVWQQTPATVKEVREAIRPRRQLAYTTVMTLMHRLYQKGFLTRTLKSRAHLYEPAVTYVEVREAELQRLVDDFFDGSRTSLADFLGGDSSNGNSDLPATHPTTNDLDEALL